MKVMAFVMAFYIIMTTPRFPVMLKQLVGFTDSDVSLRLKTVADQAAASSNVASLVPLRIRRSTPAVYSLFTVQNFLRFTTTEYNYR